MSQLELRGMRLREIAAPMLSPSHQVIPTTRVMASVLAPFYMVVSQNGGEPHLDPQIIQFVLWGPATKYHSALGKPVWFPYAALSACMVRNNHAVTISRRLVLLLQSFFGAGEVHRVLGLGQ